MIIVHCDSDKQAASVAAAAKAEEIVRVEIKNTGAASIILATGMSQILVLSSLVTASGIDWTCVTVFHLDEFFGLAASHPGSFRHYIQKYFLQPPDGAPRFIGIGG